MGLETSDSWPPTPRAVEIGDEMTHFKRFLAPIIAGEDELPEPLAFSLHGGYISHAPPGHLWRRIRQRIDLPRIPYTTTVRNFSRPGVKFEIASTVERYRVVEHGGETHYTRRMMESLRPDDVLWDIGVCVGLVALHAARICKVVGFEPDPDVRKRFLCNLELNPDLTVDIQPYAIGDTNGTATLHLGDGTSSSLRGQRGETRTTDVQVRTIDTLIEDGVPEPTVLKLDIEGAELPALRGARRVLVSGRRPRLIFLEVHPSFLPAFGGTADDVLDIVDSAGYYPIWAAGRAGQIHMILQTR